MRPSTAARAAQSLFEILSALPNYGAGTARVARTTWRDAGSCFWSVKRASPSPASAAAAAASSPSSKPKAAERPTGKAWGVLTWDGASGATRGAGTEERPARIPGARKRVWRLVE